MSLTVTQNTATLERLAKIYANAILPDSTMKIPSLQKIQSVRNTFSMFTGSVDNPLQPYKDEFTNEDTDVTLADAEYTIIPRSVRVKIAYSKFENTQWKDAIADIRAQKLPMDFMRWFLDQVGKKGMAQMESELWNAGGGLSGDEADGTPSGYTYADGFGALIKARLTAASLSGQIVTQTTSGDDPTDSTKVKAELDSVIAALPTALNNGRATIFIAPAVMEALYNAELNTAATNIQENVLQSYRRYKLYVVENLNPSRIIAGLGENLGIGLSVKGNGNLMGLSVKDQFALNGNNIAIVSGNIGYAAGIATEDWVSYEYDPT